MNRKNIILGGVAVAMATVVGASAVSAHFEGNTNQARAELSPEKRAEISQIFETKDYSAFKTHLEEMGNTNLLEKITEDNFNKFLEMRKLMEAGDKDGARTIADELGLEGQGRGIVKGVHKGNFVR